MPISGVLLSCGDGRVADVRDGVESRRYSQVRQSTGRTLVVVTDTDTVRQDRMEVEALESLDGVVAAHVVFCSVEDIATEEQA